MKEDKDLIQALEELQEIPDRDPAVVQQNRAAFLRQAESLSQETVSVSPFMRLIGRFTNGKPRFQFSTLTIGILLGIMLLTFSSGVYAARKSSPSQALYPVKLWLEDSRMAFTRSPHEQLDLRLAYAEERLHEINGFAGDLTNPSLATTLHNFDEQYNAIQTLSGEQELDNLQQERIGKIEQQYQLIHIEEEQDASDGNSDHDGTGRSTDSPSPEENNDNNDAFINGSSEDINPEDTPQAEYEDAKTKTPQAEDENKDPKETESSDEKSPTETPEPSDDSDEESHDADKTPTPEPTHEGKDDSEDSHID